MALASSALFSDSLYTLDGVKNLNLYLDNKAQCFSKNDKNKLEEFIKKELSSSGFVFGERDSIIFLVMLNSKQLGNTHAINIEIALAEEVEATRVKKLKSFALTYLASQMIESTQPYNDTLEALEMLLIDFIKSHKEDNE
jgi:hypothetical protein